jgi:hypothetical protein
MIHSGSLEKQKGLPNLAWLAKRMYFTCTTGLVPKWRFFLDFFTIWYNYEIKLGM